VVERSSCHLYLRNLQNAVDSRDGSLREDGKEKGDGEVLYATSKGSGLLGCVLDGARHQMDEDVEVSLEGLLVVILRMCPALTFPTGPVDRIGDVLHGEGIRQSSIHRSGSFQSFKRVIPFPDS
jgi:hypothetical protein